jgi:hypothetical protein
MANKLAPFCVLIVTERAFSPTHLQSSRQTVTRDLSISRGQLQHSLVGVWSTRDNEVRAFALNDTLGARSGVVVAEYREGSHERKYRRGRSG